MNTGRLSSLFLWIVGVAALPFVACDRNHLASESHSGARQALTAGRAPGVPSESAATEGAIRFLENRVKMDPEDHIAYNKLGAYYLQRLRETGSLTYLELAARAADASLATLPPEHNTDGLTILAQVEYAEHDFAKARDHARRLAELDPGKSYPFHTLGDALLELGDYEGATAAYRQMQRFAAGMEGLPAMPRFTETSIRPGVVYPGPSSPRSHNRFLPEKRSPGATGNWARRPF